MDPKLPYRYQPLFAADAIRLLVLEPCEDLETQVECSLIHTTLTECDDDVIDDYNALSYVWGDPKTTGLVLVDGKQLEVTTNLESALRHLRDPSRKQQVWADAICIDQTNDTEKAQQVSQMGEVYKLARHTIIYLGEPTQQSDLLLPYARSIYNLLGISPKVIPMEKEANHTDLVSVLNRPWFTRVWIYQELILSEDPWLQCGRVRIRWNQLCHFIQSTSAVERNADPLRTFLSMDAKRKEYRAQFPVSIAEPEMTFAKSLLEILQSRRGFGVYDPRDMLFAHLGIIVGRARGQMRVNVDYTKSHRQIYEDVVMLLLESPEHLGFEILSHAEAGHGIDSRVGELSSWTPNWVLKPRPHPYLRLRYAFSFGNVERWSRKEYHAYLTSKYYSYLSSRFPTPNHALVSPSVLACAGYFVGTISKVSRVVTSDQASWNIYSGLNFNKTLGDSLMPNEDAFKEAWSYVYNHWRDVLGPLVEVNDKELFYASWKHFDPNPSHPAYSQNGPGAGSTTPNSNINVPAQESRSKIVSDDEYIWFWEYMCRHTPRTADLSFLVARSSFGVQGYMPRGDVLDFQGCRELALHLFLHAMHESDESYHHFLFGRRFALLDNNTLCLVPESAKEGDVVCSLIGDLRLPFVLRPKVGDSASARASLEYGIRQKISVFAAAPIGHYNLVGECFAEGWMFGEKFKELGQDDMYQLWQRRKNPNAEYFEKRNAKWAKFKATRPDLQPEIFALH